MVCIVVGFPSNIAALQFEWAWHNAHLTRHISPEERISFATTRMKKSKTGKVSKRPGRPRTSLTDKLSNLHLLLRAPYFSKWPLEARFFSQDVFKMWMNWTARIDKQMTPSINVYLDLPQTKPEEAEAEFSSAQPQPSQRRKRKADLIGRGGVEGVDPTYARFKDVFEKSRFVLDDDDEHQCSVCPSMIDVHKAFYVVCPTESCQGIAHILCLADRALRENGSANSIVPQSSKCPRCHRQHPWVELMQQVSLHHRGTKEVKKLLAKKGKKSTAAVAAEIMETDSELSDEEDKLTAQQVVDEEAELSLSDETSDDDASSVASVESSLSARRPPAKTTARSPGRKKRSLEMVIEDSEDER
jgi:structure-specific endonuclease subunit SLX1